MTHLRRRIFCADATRLCASAAGLALLSSACQMVSFRAPVKVPRIGYLSPGPRESRIELVDAFLDGLRDLGYVEGESVVIEWRFAPADDAVLADLAAELVGLSVDAIVVYTTPATVAAKRATRTVPIVAVNLNFPVETGLVANLARPGANVTGLANWIPGMEAKLLELLREVVPGLGQVGVLVEVDNPALVISFDQLLQAAQAAGFQLQRVYLRSTGSRNSRSSTGCRASPTPTRMPKQVSS